MATDSLDARGGSRFPLGANDPARALHGRAPSAARLTGALILVQVLFGAHYYASKIVLDAVAPLAWASVRSGTTALLLVAAATALRPRAFPKLTRAFVVEALGLSALGIVLNQACFLAGLARTTSTNSAILNTTVPLFTLGLATLFGHERLTPRKAAGLLVALAGVLLLTDLDRLALTSGTFVGDLLTLANCVSYAAFLALGKRFVERHDPLWATAIFFTLGALGLGLVSAGDWARFALPPLTGRLVGAGVFAIVGGTFAAYLLINWVLAYVPASRVALFIYLQPVVATILGVRFLGETITWRTVAASALVFLGLVLSSADPRAWRLPLPLGQRAA